MRLHNIYSQNKAFTLIEVVIVIGLTTFIAGIGMVFSVSTYKSYLFNKEYKTVEYILSQARSQAMNNVDEKPHGIHFDHETYVLFAGPTYPSNPSSHETFAIHKEVQVSGSRDIVFEQLSGDILACDLVLSSAEPCFVSLTDNANDGHRMTVIINEYGGII